MMKNKAYDLSTYPFRKGELLLFDTNVWIYLFPVPAARAYRYAVKYSSGLKTMLHKAKYRDFKAFRVSLDRRLVQTQNKR